MSTHAIFFLSIAIIVLLSGVHNTGARPLGGRNEQPNASNGAAKGSLYEPGRTYGRNGAGNQNSTAGNATVTGQNATSPPHGKHDDGHHDDGHHNDGHHDDGHHNDGHHDDGHHDDGKHDDGHKKNVPPSNKRQHSRRDVNGHDGTPDCGPGKIYLTCGSSCPLTCRDLGQNVNCHLSCVVGCACLAGLVFREDGACVEPWHCHTTPHHAGEEHPVSMDQDLAPRPPMLIEGEQQLQMAPNDQAPHQPFYGMESQVPHPPSFYGEPHPMPVQGTDYMAGDMGSFASEPEYGPMEIYQ